ncbi:MAG: carbohydrate kinase family protein [Pseudomonadota bacterium]
MSALICGSFAFDTILKFPGCFKDHVIPEEIDILNVCFMSPSMRREFGGCAGNIAFNLNLLSGKGVPMGTVGKDFQTYSDWMDKCGISRDHVAVIQTEYTAQAFITTDKDDNQITSFHPGAMNHSHVSSIPEKSDITLGVISPDGREGMIMHSEQFNSLNVPFIFDPGQGLPMFNKEDLLLFIDQATWLIVNDYEFKMMCEKAGLSKKDLMQRVEALIVTKGANGSMIYTPKETIEIQQVPTKLAIDPTGCGDAYRGGLIYGLMRDMDWKTIGNISSLMGSIKVESAGTQNHHITLEEFSEKFQSIFGYSFR